MKTEVNKLDQDTLDKAVQLIKQGEVVAFPTETVYGLGANALSKEAVGKIFLAKGRPGDNPLIVHIADKADIKMLAAEISTEAQKVIDAFMPGAITIILKKKSIVPDCVTAGLDSVGIRIPTHPVARQFLAACGVPIAAPSANISTKISPTSANDVYKDMQGRIPLIIDGGDSQVGIESTVLDMSGDTPTILRPGAVTAKMLAEVLTDVVTFKGKVISVLPSPGMRYKHYAPVKEMVVAKNLQAALSCYQEKMASGQAAVFLCRTETAIQLNDIAVIDLGLKEEDVCHNIYAALHYAEANFDFIICEDFGEEGIYGSVMNRVNKASGGNVV